MRISKSRLFALSAAGSIFLSSLALAAPQQVKGIVVTNENGQLTLKTPSGNQVVTLSPDTSVRSISGPLGGQKESMPTSALIAGLPVTIDLNDAGQAAKVEYKASDYKTAAQIQAGVEATAAKTDEALAALSKVGEFNVRAETAVYFASGSAVISAAGKKDLVNIAKQAQGFQGYAISVLGYADPTGNAAFNQRLSARRAQTVINFLKQQPGIQPGRVLSASAMGQVNYAGAADPSTFASDRRVNVRVVTSAAQVPAGQ
jgi:outer membrane protein OmpA-like peptidoglycan-associated protein